MQKDVPPPPLPMDMSELFIEQRVCVHQERPKIFEKKWSPALCQLLPRCWAHDMMVRPEFKEVVDIMMTIVAEEKTRKERDKAKARDGAVPASSA